MRSDAQHHVTPAQADQLGRPEAGLKRHEQHQVVAPPDPGGAIRRGEHRGDLIAVEEGDGALHIAFARHREDSLMVWTAPTLGI
jgi:hypothetical protein